MNLYFCSTFTRTILPAKVKCGKHFILRLERTQIIHARNYMGTYAYAKKITMLHWGSSFKSYLFSCMFVSDVSIKCK